MSDKKDDSIFKIAINLTIACLISGCIIAGTYFFTADTAVKAEIKMRDETMKTMVKDSTDIKEIKNKDGWYEVYKDNELMGYIIPTETKGYGGKINILVAVDKEYKIITFKIITSNETPGLGDNASKEPFASQFVGKGIENMKVTKDSTDKEDIQAISGATITSKAVTLGIKNAIEELKVYLEGAEK